MSDFSKHSGHMNHVLVLCCTLNFTCALLWEADCSIVWESKQVLRALMLVTASVFVCICWCSNPWNFKTCFYGLT